MTARYLPGNLVSMKILVACEFSGIVRDAFTSLGHDALSCDLLSSEKPGKHYQGDVRDILQDGFDLMIAHPPCTYLCVSGARWFKDRLKEQEEALDFFLLLKQCPIPRICIENPVGVISTRIARPTQIIQPYHFGHAVSKKTCLWLKNLPPLQNTNFVPTFLPDIHTMPPGKDRARKRSVTFSGVAEAMADQWGNISQS